MKGFVSDLKAFSNDLVAALTERKHEVFDLSTEYLHCVHLILLSGVLSFQKHTKLGSSQVDVHLLLDPESAQAHHGAQLLTAFKPQASFVVPAVDSAD